MPGAAHQAPVRVPGNHPSAGVPPGGPLSLGRSAVTRMGRCHSDGLHQHPLEPIIKGMGRLRGRGVRRCDGADGSDGGAPARWLHPILPPSRVQTGRTRGRRLSRRTGRRPPLPPTPHLRHPGRRSWVPTHDTPRAAATGSLWPTRLDSPIVGICPTCRAATRI